MGGGRGDKGGPLMDGPSDLSAARGPFSLPAITALMWLCS